MRLMGIGFSVIDAVNLIALGAAAIRLRRPHGYQWPLLGFTALLFYQVTRAFLTFGQDETMLGFRAELFYIVPALLASTLKRKHFEPALRAIWCFGLSAAMIAAARWFLLAFGFDVGNAPSIGGYEVARVINSGATLGVAAAAVMGFRRWLNDESTPWFLPFVSLGMLAVVLFAQHRSVWVATSIMLALVIARTRVKLLLRAGIIVSLVGAVVLVEAFGLGVSGEVAESLTYAASNNGTWEWRVQRWQDVWHTHAARGPEAIIFGSGYGYSWVTGTVGVWEASPHNGFIQIAVRMGLVGAALLFGTYLSLLFRLARQQLPLTDLFFTLTVGVLVFFVPYSGSPFSGLLLGFAAACAAQLTTDKASRPEQSRRPRRGYPARVPR